MTQRPLPATTIRAVVTKGSPDIGPHTEKFECVCGHPHWKGVALFGTRKDAVRVSSRLEKVVLGVVQVAGMSTTLGCGPMRETISLKNPCCDDPSVVALILVTILFVCESVGSSPSRIDHAEEALKSVQQLKREQREMNGDWAFTCLAEDFFEREHSGNKNRELRDKKVQIWKDMLSFARGVFCGVIGEDQEWQGDKDQEKVRLFSPDFVSVVCKSLIESAKDQLQELPSGSSGGNVDEIFLPAAKKVKNSMFSCLCPLVDLSVS